MSIKLPGTIELGDKGELVRRWQTILGITADGVFGPKTRDATIDWQREHKLVPDGVVGPLSWALTLGKKPGKVKPNPRTQPTDVWAYDVAKKARPDLSEAELQYALTVARGEGYYGKGWGNPGKKTIEESAKYGLTGLEGKGSNNWGAEQGKGDAGSFQHVDHHADGSLYVSPYRRYSTPEKGFQGFSKILFSGNKRKELGAKELKEAINQGSLRKAVFAQHANGYYELAPEKYLAGVTQNYAALSANTDWKRLLSASGKLLAFVSIIWWLVGGTIVYGGYQYFKNKG